MLLSAGRLVLWPIYRREVVAVLSEVVVTCHVRGNSLEGYTKRSGRNRGRSPRVVVRIQLPERQYLVTSPLMARYCLTDSCHCVYNPGTVSRCSSPSGQIASESERYA